MNMVETRRGMGTSDPANKTSKKKKFERKIYKVVTNVHVLWMKDITIRGDANYNFEGVSYLSKPIKFKQKSMKKTTDWILLSMFDLTGKISEPIRDGEVENEPEVTCNLLSVADNIDISISLIENPPEIVRGNPIEIVITSEIVVSINENQCFVDKIED